MLSPTMQGKRITVYVNGDPFMKGKVVTLNTHQIPEFEVFCQYLTERVPNRTGGCYRRVYTPNGSEVRALDQIEAGHEYVASRDRYRPPAKEYGYREIPDRMRPPRHKGFKKIDIDRIYKVVDHARNESYRHKSAQCYKLNELQVGLRLLVSVNGENVNPVYHMTIESRKKNDLEKIKNQLREFLAMHTIKKIYKVINYGGRLENFHEVTDAKELDRGDHILVMDNRESELRPLLYLPQGKYNFSVKTSPRSGQAPIQNWNLNPYAVTPQIGSSKQSEANTMSPLSNPSGSHGGRKSKKSKGGRKINYDRDDGGVYRAKKVNNAHGAHQVNESRETRTEKPIDQMEAETVEEEEIHSQEKTTPIPAGTELNKQPSKETKQNGDNASLTKNKAEVKKGGKSGGKIGNDMNKVSVLPPIVDDRGKKTDTEKVKNGDKKEIKEGHVKETVEKYEEKVGAGEDRLFVDEKESTPKDLKTDDVIEMSEKKVTPVDLQSNDVEVNKPPLSTTPPQGKLSQGSGKLQERVDEEASPDAMGAQTPGGDSGNEHEQSTEQGMHRNDEYEDDSFNRYDQNTSGAMTKDPRSSTPASREEARRKREQVEHEAACKIQAGLRGYQARKTYKKKKEAHMMEQEDERRRQEDEARRQEDEARYQEDEARNQEDEARHREDEARDAELNAQKKQINEDEAATRIQATFKGHKARKDYKAKKQQVRESHVKQSEKENENKAATKIQANFRAYKVRKEYHKTKKQVKETDINDNEKKDMPDEAIAVKGSDKENIRQEAKMSEDKAAKAIQAGFKGYTTRKKYAKNKSQKQKNEKETKSDNDKREHMAASQIQAHFRGYKVRKDYADKKKKKKGEKEEHEAAVQIQALFRGHQARKQVSKKKEHQLPDQAPSPKGNDADELNKAAIKIQSGFRAYKTRKDYKSKVIEEHIVETDIAQLPDSAVSRSVKKGQFIHYSREDIASKIQNAFRVYHAKKIIEKGGDFFTDAFTKTREADENIVAAYRGFRTRHIEKENFQMKNSSALKIQAFYKGYKVRKTTYYSIRAINLLQATVRGYVTRKLNNVSVALKLKVITVPNGDHYASIIQALCRGFLTRYTVNKMKERAQTKPHSATSLQGPTIASVADEPEVEVSYWKDTNIKMYSDKTLRKAAARIQSVIHAYKTRKSFKKTRLKRAQSSVLKETGPPVENINAFPKIQSYFKSYLERKGSRDPRVVIDEGERAVVNYKAVKDVHSKQEGRVKLEINEDDNCERREEEIDTSMQNDTDSGLKIEKQNSAKTTDMKDNVDQKKEKVTQYVDQAGSVGTIQIDFEKNSETSEDRENVCNVVCSQENETQIHSPISFRSTNATPVISKIERQENDRSTRKRPRSERPSSGRPVSGQTMPSSRCRSTSAQKGSSGKVQSRSSENLAISFKEESSTMPYGTANIVVSESVLSMSDLDKEHRCGSAKSYRTWKSSEQNKSSGGEVEIEGESVREVEDDAGELSSIEKNVNAVSQLQAAFRAYKLRREISELMSGGGELIDIKKIDRAVSALRKDFRLRSAKERRLGSYQFEKEKQSKGCQNWWENVDYDDSTLTLQGHEIVEGQDDDNSQLIGEDNFFNERESSETDTNIKAFKREQRSKSILKIRAAVKGYEIRKDVKERKQKESRQNIEAAYRGYRTRVTETQIISRSSSRRSIERKLNRSAGSRSTACSDRTIFHVQMHSDVINERCTRLQAAFAAYQTRKVFISLTKLVEQNEHSDHDTSGHQLERMGSLSETDDFKLRHRTIAKIKSTYKIAHESKKRSRKSSKRAVSPITLNKHRVLPPIQQNVHLFHCDSSRPKSGIIRTHVKVIELPEGKSKTQPDLYGRYGHTSDTKALNCIELYIKKKMAATVIQAHGKAYLTRQMIEVKKTRQKQQQNQFATEKSSGNKTATSVGRKTPVYVHSKSSKVCFKTDANKESNQSKEQQTRKKEDTTMTEMVRVRTASIKLEAERRKVIAEKIRLNQQTETGQAPLNTANSNAEREDSVAKSRSPERLTPIPSSRLPTESSNQANCSVLREEKAAIKIQKVYRGYRIRQDLDQKTDSRKQLDKEYSDWKVKRKDAAVAIQSAWRGYSVRRGFSDKEIGKLDKDDRTKDEFSHLDEDKGLIVINIGRSKSEIERANRKYSNASMIQMIFRACKIRRKMAIRGAKRRQEKNKAASKIQALYRAYWTRHKLNESVSATRIQKVFKAYLARDSMQERMRAKEEQRQTSASLLQAAYFSFRKRRENKAMQKERRLNKASECIQSAGKGFVVRWENIKRRESNQMRAALQIQSVFKGQKERQKVKIWKEAAIKIVGGFMSYKTRQVIQTLKDKLERERIASTRLQAAYRAFLVRNSNRQYKEKMVRQKKAATKIQCSFRGRESRKHYRRQKEIEEKVRQSAALKIQSVYRGHKGRNIAMRERHILEIHNFAEEATNLILNRTFDYARRRTDSSERIQATMKGYDTRRQMTSKLTNEAKQSVLCASVIQAVFRANADRKQTERKSLKDSRASMIQSVFRANTERERTDRKSHKDVCAKIIQSVFRANEIRKKRNNKKLLELVNESATKIQSLFRGHRTRTEIQKEREMIANLEPPPTPLVSARTRSGKLLSLSMDEVLMKNSRAIILFHRKATELQEAFRAYITRNDVKDRFMRKTTVSKRTPRRVLSVSKRLSKADKAAILIQKTFRGYWNRRVYKNAMAKRRKLRYNAATSLQAAVKGYRVRMDESGREMRLKKEGMSEIWRQKQEAATIISFAYRSYQHRKVKRALRVEM